MALPGMPGPDSADHAANPAPFRATLVDHHRRLAIRLARRYRGTANPGPEIADVAIQGLKQAAEIYDPQVDDDFQAVAVPAVIAATKAHYRDSGPDASRERDAEIQSRVEAGLAELSESRTRITVSDLAVFLELPIETIVDALALVDRRALTASLCGASRSSEPTDGLSSYEREIYRLRYGCDLSVASIATTLGVGEGRIRTILATAVRDLHAETVLTH